MTGLMGYPLAIQDFRTEADALGVARRQSARLHPARQDGERRRAILTRTVELDVIPRLLIAHPAPPAPARAGLLVAAVHVADLVGLVLSRGEAEAVSFVAAMHEGGAAAESLYLDLLAPAARRLGEMWENDTCDFTDVTIGLLRLHNAMRELSPSFLRSASLRSANATTHGPRALLVPLPGEDHTFGLSMVYEFFRRAGWNAWCGPVESSADLRGLVRREWVEVIGFSLACDEKLDAVRAEIRSVRRASMNPGLAVLVGGPGFIANPGLAAEVGADGTATDGHQAVLQAQALIDVAAKRR